MPKKQPICFADCPVIGYNKANRNIPTLFSLKDGFIYFYYQGTIHSKISLPVGYMDFYHGCAKKTRRAAL